MYATWRIIDIKEELKKRGASLKGKKSELIERLELYDKNFNFGTVDPDGEDVPNMEVPPIAAYKDVNSVTAIPTINLTQIQHYLNFTTKKFAAAKQVYESRPLLVVRAASKEDTVIIKGFCKKSMKNMQYEEDVKLHPNGCPEQSHCECPAGSGTNATCKHVAVLLLAIEILANHNVLILHEVPTQQLQTWNCPKKKYTGSPRCTEKLSRKRKANIFYPYPLEK